MASSWDYEASFDDGHVVHAPVGSFAPNAISLHDVLGNVWEWCRDRHAGYTTTPSAVDGLRDSDEALRIARGGCFLRPARSAFRNFTAPNMRDGSLGVRPAWALFRQP